MEHRIRKLLIANRGEIATRIISAARELAIETYALSTSDDVSHAVQASHVIQLKSPSEYLSIPALIAVIKSNGIDAVHPGYGFLSENAEFARRVQQETGAFVIGPGPDVLERTGDKLSARALAERNNVPCLPAMNESTDNVQQVEHFARSVGFPIMLKAVDGGGGRGIRLVHKPEDLSNLAKRAIEESPSKRVFAEKAAVDGYRHVEVQVVGDGTGNVRHLWERECSIQRRYQKIIELAPSTISNRALVMQVIKAALRMAQSIKYSSLGTFEFLVNPKTEDFYFLEINPRLQVEHTITESITNLDIVSIQLAIAQGASLDSAIPDLKSTQSDTAPGDLHSIQLRVTAENAHANHSLSIGKITSFAFPTGNGMRVDTALVPGFPTIVTADFDSLLAKIIITASSWPAAVAKAKRALEDTRIEGVTTNLNVLRGIVASDAFAAGKCDTTWLESNLAHLISVGDKLTDAAKRSAVQHKTTTSADQPLAGSSSGTVVLRRGDAWSIKLSPTNAGGTSTQNHLKLLRVIRNELPASLAAEVEYTTPGGAATYKLDFASSSASAGAVMAAGKHRRGDPANPLQVVIPFNGRLVEVLVDEGDLVQPGDVVCVVQQMKMELEVRAARAGVVKWVTDAEDGADVGEGMLAAELEDKNDDARARL